MALCGFARLATILALSVAVAGCELEPGKVDRIIHAEDARPKLVMTDAGPVVGVASTQGEAFLGIPYAAAPIGRLRWRAPQPVAPWSEPRPATKLGEPCLENLSLDAQTGRKGSGPIVGSEDCLTLNVYAPAGTQPGDRRPVMVWIHGGAFMLGSGGQYDPSLLARNTGAVLVTFNYRLGALGFLAHPGLRGEPGEGAYALLDQQAVLRWVRATISGFGGDPRKVTLFGQSAGAWSVCYQLASPAAAGLFSRAIIESGSCTTPQTSIAVEEAEAGGQRFAEDLGCPGGDPIACLRAKRAEDLMSALPERRGVTGPQSWAPVFGRDVLPSSPKAAFEAGRFNRVPVIQGTTRDEGRLFSYFRAYQGDLWTESSYRDAIAQMFGERSPAVLAQYPAETLGSLGLAYGAVLTDALFACAARSLDGVLAQRVPVYAYEFDDPEAPFGLPHLPWSEPLRAYHAAEIAYVFDRPWPLADPDDFDEAQQGLSTAMQTYWGAFARSGDPNRTDAPRWQPYDGRLDGVLTLAPPAIAPSANFAQRHRCAFWQRLGY